MSLQTGLGFRSLSAQEQNAYRVVLKAFSSMSASFDASSISRNVDFMKIIQVVLGDNPAVIYFNKTQIETTSSILRRQIRLTGVLPKSQINRMNAELDKKANMATASIISGSNDDYSLLIKVYEYLQKNVNYDMQEFQAEQNGRAKNTVSHNAYGALVNGTAVCDGFSSAFALLTQKLGFECMLARGRSSHRSTGPAEHAWNIIKIRNKCCHMDVTWDSNQFSELGEHSYDYFALDDKEISSDHDWDRKTTPACTTGEFSYYAKNRLHADNQRMLEDIIRASVKNRGKPVRIKLSRSINLPANAGDHLGQYLINEAAKTWGSAQINYSWNENTRCFYAKFVV